MLVARILANRVYAELTTDEFGLRPVGRAEQRRITGSNDVARRLPAIHPMIAVDSGDAVNHQAEFAAACASESGDRAVLDGAIAMAWTAVIAATEPDHRSALAALARDRPAGKHSEAGAGHTLRAAAERNTSGGVP